GLVHARHYVLRTKFTFSLLEEGDLRVFAQVHRVGAHVGDESGFVEFLRDSHGARRRKSKARGGSLLQGGGSERSAWSARLLRFFNSRDSPRAFLSGAKYAVGLGLRLSLFRAGHCKLLALLALEIAGNDPEFDGDEGANLALAFH